MFLSEFAGSEVKSLGIQARRRDLNKIVGFGARSPPRP